MTTPRTLIHAGHVIAFDGRSHRLLRDGAVVLEGDRIVHVGPRASFRERVDETVDARDRVLTPGLISTHAHIAGSPLDRSFIEDTGRPQFYYSGLFETLPVRDGAQDEAASRACVDFSMALDGIRIGPDVQRGPGLVGRTTPFAFRASAPGFRHWRTFRTALRVGLPLSCRGRVGGAP